MSSWLSVLPILQYLLDMLARLLFKHLTISCVIYPLTYFFASMFQMSTSMPHLHIIIYMHIMQNPILPNIPWDLQLMHE